MGVPQPSDRAAGLPRRLTSKAEGHSIATPQCPTSGFEVRQSTGPWSWPRGLGGQAAVSHWELWG